MRLQIPRKNTYNRRLDGAEVEFGTDQNEIP